MTLFGYIGIVVETLSINTNRVKSMALFGEMEQPNQMSIRNMDILKQMLNKCHLVIHTGLDKHHCFVMCVGFC